MFRLTACFVAFCASVSGSAALAGAWARTPGEVFLSFSTAMSTDLEALSLGALDPVRYDSAYLEYGLGQRLTFGLDLGRGEYVQEAMAFLRYTITPPDTRLQLAGDIGAGRRSVEVLGDSTLLRAGLSVGYGFSLEPRRWLPQGLSGGWASVDAVAIWDMDRDENRWKVEATLGLSASDRLSLMIQAVAEQWPGLDVGYSLNPSVVVQIGQRSSLELGVRTTLSDDPEVGLELGFWRRF